MIGAHRLLPVLLLLGCVAPKRVMQDLWRADELIAKSTELQGRHCAPEALANAVADAAFARIEFLQASPHRARDHASDALTAATAAWAASEACGSSDGDADGIPDVVDRCPDEKEDYDDDRDEDGCRDVEPIGDEDGDGIKNIDDDCVDVPEDFDGHNDEDGCPETSEDSDGDGIIDALDRCADEAEDLDGFKDADGCPDPDNDSDGIPDHRDACPVSAEDPDSWEDEDGCPEADNDLDGIADIDDQCPNAPGFREQNGCPAEDADHDGVADDADLCPTTREVMNDYLDDDGCPDTPPTKIRVTSTRILMDDKVQFETGKDRLLASANVLLEEIAQVLRDAPGLKLRIEGHTDSEGSDDANLRLSQRRSDAVRAWLMDTGIDGRRIVAEGFGEFRPIDTNRTSTGRSNNRRVEFHVLRE